MIKRQISFLFEDPGFCIDVFCTIAEPVRYYNRDTESGAWYSSTPDWNENGSLIREDLIFEVIADGVVCALDGNGNFEGKKPFVPFCQFRQSLVQSVHKPVHHANQTNYKNRGFRKSSAYFAVYTDPNSRFLVFFPGHKSCAGFPDNKAWSLEGFLSHMSGQPEIHELQSRLCIAGSGRQNVFLSAYTPLVHRL